MQSQQKPIYLHKYLNLNNRGSAFEAVLSEKQRSKLQNFQNMPPLQMGDFSGNSSFYLLVFSVFKQKFVEIDQTNKQKSKT